MTENPSMEQTVVYAQNADSQYVGPYPESSRLAGVVPLDTLPAAWWNLLWQELANTLNNAQGDLSMLYAELNNVLTAAGVTPSSSLTTNVLTAITTLTRLYPRTENSIDIPGAVKSSGTSDLKGVYVDSSTGYMQVNGLKDWDSTSTVKQAIASAASGVALTAGKGINISNQQINVTNPVYHYTDTEWALLTDAQKAAIPIGALIVDDGSDD